VHPHGLRHTHAYELANEGTPLHVIQQQLGHSSLATTDRYIRHLNPQQVVEACAGGRGGRECFSRVNQGRAYVIPEQPDS
jgi:hypothetical protein